MANRFWIGGTGNWSDTAHWSTSTGGGGGAVVPTSSDDVFIDANSGFGGGGTLNVIPTGDSVCHDFICTSGHSFVINSTNPAVGFSIYGSMILEAGITWTNYIVIYFYGDAQDDTITMGGSVPYSMGFSHSGTITLLDNVIIDSQFAISYSTGTFDANDHNITANDFYFYTETGYAPTVIMGSGVWEADGGTESGAFNPNPWKVDENNGEIVTFTCETSTIKLTDTSSYIKILTLGGKTYYNFWVAGAETGEYRISGSNTFNEFKVTTPPHSIKFANGTTQTVTTWNVVGTGGNLNILDTITSLSTGPIVTGHITTPGTGYSVDEVVGLWDNGGGDAELTVTSIDGSGGITGFTITTAGTDYDSTYGEETVYGGNDDALFVVDTVSGTQFTLSKSSGTVICDYLDISNSNAAGGATWYAGSNSADTLNNDGWLFEDPPIVTYTLTYTAGANGSITGTSPQTVNSGGNGTEVTAVADTGYHFTSWSDAVLTASRTDTNITSNLSVTASFEKDISGSRIKVMPRRGRGRIRL